MKPAADTIYLNGNIYLGQSVQNGNPTSPGPSARAEAIAVKGDRILAVGTNQDVRRYRDGKTKTVDLGEHFLMPAFNDAHVHLAAGGLEKLQVDLAGAKSLHEMQARIAAHMEGLSAGQWILGRGWDHTLWPERRLPNRRDIDAVVQNHPAYLSRVDGHIAVVSSAALVAAGITAATPDPPGGKIDRDAQGEPTGILRETADEMLRAKLPPPTSELRRRAIELALAEAARCGIGSVQDNSDWEDFLVYEDLEREGKLSLRITEWLPFDQAAADLAAHRARHPQTDPRLHTGMLKAFLDGSLGSRTAALLAPYADDPGNLGLLRYDLHRLGEMIDERVESRFQVGFHAIGDRAVQMALDAFAEAERYARERAIMPPAGGDFRFRIEHAQVVTADQFQRFRELRVIASMQPGHLLTDMNWAWERLGPQRARYSYAWKSFLDHGVILAFGTDFPVEPISPFRGLYAAITRKNEAGTKEYFPEERIAIDQAITAYTAGSAYAELADKEKGVLRPGMLADFVVLDRDLTKVTPREVLGARVLRTVVGGQTVYEADDHR
jgi:hypothetical protein